MPGFDPEIAKLAQRILINPRKIDYHTGVFASKVSSNFNLALRAMSIFWTLSSNLQLEASASLDYPGKGWEACVDRVD